MTGVIASTRSARTRPGRGRRALARRGRGRGRVTGWPRCTAPRPTSASPATRSAAASAGTPASSACRPTASPRSSWSPPTARWSAPTRPRTRSCSGRCAAAAATSAWSPRSSSSCSRSRRRTPACSCGTRSRPSRCCAAGPTWAPTRPTRSPRRCASCGCRRSRDPRDLRGRQIVVIDGAVLGDDERGRELPRARCARWSRDGHLRPGAGAVAGPAAHGPRGPDARRSPTPRCSATSRPRRSTPSSRPPARAPDRRCWWPSCVSSVVRWAARMRAAVRCPARRGVPAVRRRDRRHARDRSAQGRPTRPASSRRWRRGRTAGSTSTSPRRPVDASTAYDDLSWAQLQAIRRAVDPTGSSSPTTGSARREMLPATTA